jgi:hypothetical protein
LNSACRTSGVLSLTTHCSRACAHFPSAPRCLLPPPPPSTSPPRLRRPRRRRRTRMPANAGSALRMLQPQPTRQTSTPRERRSNPAAKKKASRGSKKGRPGPALLVFASRRGANVAKQRLRPRHRLGRPAVQQVGRGVTPHPQRASGRARLIYRHRYAAPCRQERQHHSFARAHRRRATQRRQAVRVARARERLPAQAGRCRRCQRSHQRTDGARRQHKRRAGGAGARYPSNSARTGVCAGGPRPAASATALTTIALASIAGESSEEGLDAETAEEPEASARLDAGPRGRRAREGSGRKRGEPQAGTAGVRRTSSALTWRQRTAAPRRGWTRKRPRSPKRQRAWTRGRGAAERARGAVGSEVSRRQARRECGARVVRLRGGSGPRRRGKAGHRIRAAQHSAGTDAEAGTRSAQQRQRHHRLARARGVWGGRRRRVSGSAVRSLRAACGALERRASMRAPDSPTTHRSGKQTGQSSRLRVIVPSRILVRKPLRKS